MTNRSTLNSPPNSACWNASSGSRGSSVSGRKQLMEAAIGERFRGSGGERSTFTFKTLRQKLTKAGGKPAKLIRDRPQHSGTVSAEDKTRRESKTPPALCCATKNALELPRAFFRCTATSLQPPGVGYFPGAGGGPWHGGRTGQNGAPPWGQHQALAGHPETPPGSGAPPGGRPGSSPPGIGGAPGPTRAACRQGQEAHPAFGGIPGTPGFTPPGGTIPPGGIPGDTAWQNKSAWGHAGQGPPWVHTTRRHPRQARSAHPEARDHPDPPPGEARSATRRNPEVGPGFATDVSRCQ